MWFKLFRDQCEVSGCADAQVREFLDLIAKRLENFGNRSAGLFIRSENSTGAERIAGVSKFLHFPLHFDPGDDFIVERDDPKLVSVSVAADEQARQLLRHFGTQLDVGSKVMRFEASVSDLSRRTTALLPTIVGPLDVEG